MILRRWRHDDQDILTPLLLDYLVSTDGEYDYRPTRENAEFLFSLGVDPVGMGVVAECDGLLVGFANVIHTWDRFKVRIAYGMGTFVTPDYRNRGIAQSLHDYSATVVKAEGYGFIDRISNGGMGEPMLQRNGWLKQGTLYRRAL